LRPATGVIASALLAPLVDGPRRDLRIVHRSRHACQLADPAGSVVASVILPDSLRLPHAAVVPSLPQGSSPVSVGGGSWGWDGFRASVSRWWRPSRPDLPLLQSRLDDGAVAEFAARWRSNIGRGDGLTPYADDVVCGSLVTLHAARHPAARDISDELLSTRLERRTTATSAALLRLAARGYCLDELADYLAAVSAGPVDDTPQSVSNLVPSCRSAAGEMAPATACLLAVGHSSGQGLVVGVTSLLRTDLAEVAA
jgi:hypothetical protein